MLSTYIVYNFILFASSFFAYKYEKSNILSNRSKLWYVLAFAIPFFFLAIRYEIGTDYNNYIQYFYWITEDQYYTKEPGYLFVNLVIAYFNLDVQWLFVFFGFFTLFFSYKALPKKGFFIGVFLFITIFYLYEGYSAIRQGLAIAIMAYASKYIIEKKWQYYLAFGGVAMLFHSITAIMLVVLYPIINKRTNEYFLIATIVFLFYIILNTEIPQQLLFLSVELFPRYIWYLESEFSHEAQVSFGIVGPLIKTFIVITILLFKDKIVTKFPNANVHLNFLFVYEISYLFHLKIQIFGRVEHIFIFSLIISLVFFINTIHKKLRFLVIFIVLLFYYFMFIRYITNGTLEIENTVHISPYQTIFSR